MIKFSYKNIRKPNAIDESHIVKVIWLIANGPKSREEDVLSWMIINYLIWNIREGAGVW